MIKAVDELALNKIAIVPFRTKNFSPQTPTPSPAHPKEPINLLQQTPSLRESNPHIILPNPPRL